MRELVLTCALAILGSGCVEVISHRDEFDAGPDIVISDGPMEAEASGGQCTSGQRWTLAMNSPSPLMTPARPCLGPGCHTSSSKTQFTMAGTVYPLKGEHDVDDCNGIDGQGVAVVPMDDMGNELIGRIQLNSVGNFTTNKALPSSYKVKVIRGGAEAIMKAAVTDPLGGNCNYCHTRDDYMGAKGRIVPLAP